MKRLLKWLLIAFTGLVILVVAAALFLPRVYQDNVRADIEKEINQKVNATVTFDEASLKLFKHFPNLTLTLDNLCIVGKDEFKSDTLTHAKNIQLEINLWSLIGKKEVEINSIYLVQPEINVYVLKNGKTNYDIVKYAPVDSSDTPTKSSSFHVAVDQFIIRQGIINYDNQQKNIFVTVHDIEHKGGGDFKTDIFDYETETTIQELSLSIDKVQYLFKKAISIDLITEVNLPESKFTFKENEIRINHFSFSVQGFFQRVIDHYAMNMKFQAQETSFKNILSLVPGIYLKDFDNLETNGDMGFNGRLDGVYSSTDNEMPAFHVDVNVKNAMVKIDSLPESFNHIQFELTVDNNERILDSTVIALKNFHVELGKHPIHGNLSMQGVHKPKIKANIFADVELASLERFYPVKGIDLKGKINFEWNAQGVFDYKNSLFPTFNLNLALANGYFKYDSLPRPVSNINFHLNAESKDGKLNNTIIDFKKIHAEVDDNILHGYAHLKGYPNSYVDADLDADFDLEDLEKIYPVKDYALKGHFNLDLLVKGVYNRTNKLFPFVDTKIKLTDGSVRYNKYPYPIKNIHFLAEITSKGGNLSEAKVNVSRMTYTLEDQPFEITGSVVDLNNYQYAVTINGKADLSKLNQVIPLQGMKMAGLIDAQLKTSGLVSDLEKGNYTNVSSAGRINFKDISLSGTAVKRPILINGATLTFTPSKIFLTRFDGKLGKSNVTLNGEVSNYMAFATRANDLITADLKLQCDTLDINEWMPPPQTATGKPVLGTDTTHSKVTAVEIPRNIHFVFDSQIDALTYDDLEITKLDGEITMKDGVLSLHETGFNSLNAQFNVSGDYDTQDPAHPLFDFDVDVKDLDINKAYRKISLMRQLAPSAGKASGIFSVAYKLKGELNKNMQPQLETLIGGGVIRIADAKIKGMKLFEEISKSAKKKEINDPHLKDFSIETEIRDSKIIVKPFSMELAGFDADIEGVNTMNGMIDYLVKVELVPLTKIKIPFHVTGRYDNPKVALGKGHKLPY